MPTSDVLFSVLSGPYGSIGLITLNRPEQLNALNQSMCVAIHSQLLTWATLDAIKAVVIYGAGDKAFCAGGDIRDLYKARDNFEFIRDFFSQEYRLNHTIYHFPKPYIALLNGLTMGGGLGISVHGKYRISSEHLKLAMPETGIGFFTDVGASYFLSRCPGKLGLYLGLTGTFINAADAFAIGLVDKILKDSDFPLLLTALTQAKWSVDLHQTVQQIIDSFSHSSPQPVLTPHRPIIDRCFSHSSVEKILAALLKQSDPWSKKTHQLLKTRSPTSLKVVFEELNRGTTLSFDDCLRMEYRIANHFHSTPDLYEGIRAAIIDKDRSPHWCPATLEKITSAEIACYFAPLQEIEELSFNG